MPIDPDLIRVDLLLVKRKLFTSYAPGSKGQQDFLAASKLSELSYLSKLVSPDITNLVFEEYHQIIKKEIIDISIFLLLGIVISYTLFILHQIFPKNVWLYLFSAPFWIGLTESLRHVWHIVEQYRKMEPFRNDYKVLNDRIKKLANELRDIQ